VLEALHLDVPDNGAWLIHSLARSARTAQPAVQQAAVADAAAAQLAAGSAGSSSAGSRVTDSLRQVVQHIAAVMLAVGRAAQSLWQQVGETVRMLVAGSASIAAIAAAVLAALALLLLAARLWRGTQRRRRQRQQAQRQQQQAAALTRQKQRMLQALDEYVDPGSPAAEARSFAEILEDYQFVLDSRVASLDADGLPVGEGILNPMYPQDSELQEQWAGFVAGSKLHTVRTWWDIEDAVQQPLTKVENIDWNA
jgi:cell division protein ZapA (FtsZ GTPase activity inhibitor)